MKRLYLMRHAKSDWNISTRSDFDRTLNERGFRDAPNMANRLKIAPYLPQQIHHSAAIRTQQTAQLVAEKINLSSEYLIAHQSLYEAGINEYLKVIRTIPDTFQTALIVGHNPTITHLVGYLTPQNITHMPTSAITCIQFEIASWTAIEPLLGKFYWFDYPKNEFIPVYL